MAFRKVAKDYEGLIAAFRARAAHLQVSRQTLDDVSGLPDYYCAKLLGPKRVKHIGSVSLGPLLGALGLKLIVCEDPKSMRRYATRRKRRVEWCVRGEA